MEISTEIILPPVCARLPLAVNISELIRFESASAGCIPKRRYQHILGFSPCLPSQIRIVNRRIDPGWAWQSRQSRTARRGEGRVALARRSQYVVMSLVLALKTAANIHNKLILAIGCDVKVRAAVLLILNFEPATRVLEEKRYGAEVGMLGDARRGVPPFAPARKAG